MSISSPLKNPTQSPSFLPLMNPNDETAMIMRLGAIFAKERARKSVVCSTKHMDIIKNKTIFRRMLTYILFCRVLSSCLCIFCVAVSTGVFKLGDDKHIFKMLEINYRSDGA